METGWDLILLPQSDGISCARRLEALLACGETTENYGLRLTPQQAQALLDTRSAALQKTGRLEWGEGILPQLALTFCDSPYLSQDNWADTLHTLIELFYYFKNETDDRIGDQGLLNYMKRAFDGPCRGSAEMLADTALPELARRLRTGRMPQWGEGNVHD